MKTLSKSRDLSFDVTRVVCTLWIVGIWHLMNYIPNQAPAALTTGIGEPVTITALSCFMFISGYFLRKYPFRDRADVLILPETIFPVLRLIFSFGDHLADRRLFHGQVLV